MEDFKKIGWMIFNLIIYGSWISIINYIETIVGIKSIEDISMFYVIFSLLIQWVGGIFVVFFVQDFISRKFH